MSIILLETFDCPFPPFLSYSLLSVTFWSLLQLKGGLWWVGVGLPERSNSEINGIWDDGILHEFQGLFITVLYLCKNWCRSVGHESKRQSGKNIVCLQSEQRRTLCWCHCWRLFQGSTNGQVTSKGDSESDNVEEVIDALWDSRGEQNLKGFVLTAAVGSETLHWFPDLLGEVLGLFSLY